MERRERVMERREGDGKEREGGRNLFVPLMFGC